MKAASMTRVALFAALIAVLSQLSIPMPTGMPLTLQTFAAALAGYVLGPRHGTAAVGVFLALGAVGLPVFSGFTGGLGRLFDVTGGFLWGFLALAALCGLGRTARSRAAALAAGAAGLLVCHAAGAAWYAAVTGTNWRYAVLLISAPYLAKDLFSLAGAWAIASRLRPRADCRGASAS